MTDLDPGGRWQRRWLLLSVLRILGIVLAVIGLAMWRKTVFGLHDALAGRIVFAAGLFASLALPALIRRHWRKTDAAGK